MKPIEIVPSKDDADVKKFCHEFIFSDRPKYLFGRNIYANKVLRSVEVQGFIDDFTNEKHYLGKPVVRLNRVPDDSLVLILAGGRPLTSKRLVQTAGLECLDYFAFYKYSGLKLEPIVFLGDFEKEFHQNQSRFQAIYERLADQVSRDQFSKLINFKLSLNLSFLEGFLFSEDQQYFEDFISFSGTEEVFADVGGFDGFTSNEFIKHCPKYKAIHFFEPEKKMMNEAKARLSGHKNVHFYLMGLSDRKQQLRFDVEGSRSKISKKGRYVIDVDRMDDKITDIVTFIKIDVEGAEASVVEGARRIIKENHPKIAVSVYHKPEDFWKIPEQILSIRNDYDLYLRHYTESVYETVMFFVPRTESSL